MANLKGFASITEFMGIYSMNVPNGRMQGDKKQKHISSKPHNVAQEEIVEIKEEQEENTMLKNNVVVVRARGCRRAQAKNLIIFKTTCKVGGKCCTIISDESSTQNLVSTMVGQKLNCILHPNLYNVTKLLYMSNVKLVSTLKVIQPKCFVMLFLWMPIIYCWIEPGSMIEILGMIT
jgi:hypothetical protein